MEYTTISQKKKMFSDPGEERVSRDLTAEICEPLSLLRQKIVVVETHLCLRLFKKFWRSLTVPINSYIYEDFIKKAYFSPSGALQFDFDMKTLFLVFKPYSQKTENFFKEIKESCSLEDFLELTKSTNPQIRKQALKTLCPCKVKSDIELIWNRVFEMYNDEDAGCRYQILHTICDGSPKEREEKVIETLEALWNDPDEKIRRNVRKALNSYRRTGKWNIL